MIDEVRDAIEHLAWCAKHGDLPAHLIDCIAVVVDNLPDRSTYLGIGERCFRDMIGQARYAPNA